MRLFPVERLGVSAKPIAAGSFATGGGLAPHVSAMLLTAVAKLVTILISWLSLLTSSFLIGGFYDMVSCPLHASV